MDKDKHCYNWRAVSSLQWSARAVFNDNKEKINKKQKTLTLYISSITEQSHNRVKEVAWDLLF